MPQTCSICRSSDKAEIDSQLIAGESLRSISKRFGTSPAAVFRHKQNHLPEKLALAKHRDEALSADALIEEMRGLKESLLAGLKQAERAKNPVAFVAFAKEYRQALESLIDLSDRVAAKATDGVLSIRVVYGSSNLRNLTAEEQDVLQRLTDKATGRAGCTLGPATEAVLSLCSGLGITYSAAKAEADRRGQSMAEFLAERTGMSSVELKRIIEERAHPGIENRLGICVSDSLRH